jgi:predicted ABC-type sugar transport system permease subunit
VLAVIIDAALSNGLIRLEVPLYWSEVAGGVLLLAAATIDRLRLRVTHASV